MTATPAKPSRKRRIRRAAPAELQRHLQAAAELQIQIQKLELAQQVHREWLLKFLETHPEPSVSLGDFQAALRSRANWTYSPALQREMLQVKQLQKLEQGNGEATNRPTPYVAFAFKAAKS